MTFPFLKFFFEIVGDSVKTNDHSLQKHLKTLHAHAHTSLL